MKLLDSSYVHLGVLSPEETDCPICLEVLFNNEGSDGASHRLLTLACGHIYGDACIRTWLKKQDTCPKCRRIVFEAPEQEPEEGQLRWLTRDVLAICIDDDRTNLAMLLAISDGSSLAGFLVNLDLLRTRDYYLHHLLDFRADLYLSGRLDPNPEDYQPYPLDRMPAPLDATTLSEAHVIDSESMIERLLEYWDDLCFGDDPNQLPTVASHPIVWLVYHMMCDCYRMLTAWSFLGRI